MPESVRVSKTALLAEVGGDAANTIAVSKAFLLVELSSATIYTSQVFLLAEVGGDAENTVIVSDLFVLYELLPSSPYPVKVKDNVGITFDGNDLIPYIQSFSLAETTKTVDTTTMASTDTEVLGVSVDWVLTFDGLWVKDLDDILGQTISDEQVLVSCAVRLGPITAPVNYQWDSNAFVSSYRVSFDVDDVGHFSASIALSGAPSRS